MSRAHLPRSEVYLALVSDLRLEGYRFREEMGGKHGRLIVSVNGREEVIIVSTSPSDRHASKNASRHLRRRIREWKAEAVAVLPTETAPARFPTLEKETMDDSTIGVAASTEPVISVRSGRAVTDSRAVAAGFGKELKHVHESIRRLLAQEPTLQSSFRPFKINDLTGQSVSHYEMDRDGFSLLAMGFTGAAALKWKLRYIQAFNAMERELASTEQRTFGIAKMLSRKVTELEKVTGEILAYITDPSGDLVPAHNLAGTVTALKVIEMAGIAKEERVRGTSAIVTRHLKDFCLPRGLKAYTTPENIDPSRRWRFPVEAAREWLTGATRGAEIIRSHVAKQRAKHAKGGKMALQLVEGGRP